MPCRDEYLKTSPGPRSYPGLLRWASLAATLLIGGCALLLPQPYGEAVPDADSVRPDGGPNRIPPNAPSIMNGHWADYDGHEGIDVIGDVGLPVLAPADGVVTRSFFEPMYGHAVFIEHGKRPDGTALRTRFVHLDERLVDVGNRVARGEQIGALGRTGLLAGGIPHLHYEVQTLATGRWEIFQVTNPHLYWVNGPGDVTCFDRRKIYPSEPFRTTYPVPCRGIPWRQPLAFNGYRKCIAKPKFLPQFCHSANEIRGDPV